MRPAALLVAVFTVLGLTACNDCGTYTYQGLEATEWCGSVYGTQGQVFEVEDDPEQTWAVLHFEHSVPPGEVDFEHSGRATASLLWDDLASGEPLDAAKVLTECEWVDSGVPFQSGDDSTHREQATSVAVRGHGARLNLDPGNSLVREVSWDITCGEGQFVLSAKDIISFSLGTASATDQYLRAHLDQGDGGDDSGER